MEPANFIIDQVSLTEQIVCIRDIGPWERHLTVTNDAERVVRKLVEDRILPEGWRLYYFDSDSNLDEILIKNGKFYDFRIIPSLEKFGW